MSLAHHTKNIGFTDQVTRAESYGLSMRRAMDIVIDRAMI
jgi:hypothetical protein